VAALERTVHDRRTTGSDAFWEHRWVPTPVFDGHNDALTASHHSQLASGAGVGHIDLPRMRAGGMRGGMFAVYASSSRMPRRPMRSEPGVLSTPFASRVPHARAAADASAAAGRLFALERKAEIVIARGVADVDMAFAQGATGPPVAVLHIEGAEAIDTELESLETWYAAGLRSLGPVWSRPNAFAEGVPFIFGAGPDTGPGLTDAGVRLVRRCAELGVMVDLAHLNEAGFWDVAQLELGPLVSSHAGACGVSLTSRNLTDAQLDAVAHTGGLVGIVFAVYFLDPQHRNDPGLGINLIVEHARYVADRIGVDHVALGSDFDGTTVPDELGSVAGLPLLIEALADGGFTTSEVEQIAWRNWRRVLADWWV
jgi:membrane dipeptidase